ncbi:MAG: PSD1 and planctomycete cytochrome C domain-containing protein [Pirellulales bacterium]
MKTFAKACCAVLAVVVLWQCRARGASPTQDKVSPQDIDFFEKEIRPLLAANCFECHGEKKQEAGLRLDARLPAMRGGDEGPVIKAGDPEASKLVAAVRYTGDIQMPPDGKLPSEKVEVLAAWVKRGAPWPDHGSLVPSDDDSSDKAENHWAFQPVREPPLPTVNGSDWVRSPVDAFILARLEAAGIAPSKPADRRTLLRRVTLDLTGLPPTPAEVEEFVNDASPNAFEQVVDRLLASPRYGERWGRFWLDYARYSDTKGYVFQEDRNYRFAYVYRDWVIRAFNEDLPYDQFLVRQIAADRLPRESENNQQLAAMGFLTVGRRFLNNKYDIIDDRIDVVMRTTMALTVSCARCHDHKFDPIPTADYYSIFGVFDASVEKLLPIAPPSAEFEQGVREREEKLEKFMEEKRRDLEARLRADAAEFLLATRSPPGTDENMLRRDRKTRITERWRQYLSERGKEFDPLFAPWCAFAALADGEFEKHAVSLSASFAKADVEGGRLNTLVAKAFAGEPPKSLAEVSARYGRLFAEIDAEWKKSADDAKTKNEPPPTALAGADAEQIRQVLYGSDSPLVLPGDMLDRSLERPDRNEARRLRQEIEKFRTTSKSAPLQAMGMEDAARIPPKTRVLLRGSPGRPGPEVARQFVSVVAGESREPFNEGSGRLELAHEIVAADNPLTSRVLVNRVWTHYFGQGLVRTPSDFGLRSDPPSHPELLDYLASRFVAEGWSIKKLHRWILLSSTYQQSSEDRPEARAKDPENLLVWRMNRRRMDLEALRDSLLFVAGQLDATIGGPAVNIVTAPFSKRRSVYGQIERQNLPAFFRTFDFATPDSHSPQRFTTTVPQQALFLMNSPFVIEQAAALVKRPEIESAAEPGDRIQRIYALLFGREATTDELALGEQFVTAGDGAESNWQRYAQALMVSNEFLFID